MKIHVKELNQTKANSFFKQLQTLFKFYVANPIISINKRNINHYPIQFWEMQL